MSRKAQIPESLTEQEVVSPALLDVKDVAKLLGCSERHVVRLADSGRMPPPVKLGTLRRWQALVLNEWVSNGCPVVRRRAK